jgi:tripartite-type tricarboxylate transporter receptor subunit TctC
MASVGIGSSPHIYGELFQSMAAIELLHVPYRGPYVPDVLAGRGQVTFMPIRQAVGYVRSGKLRALGVTSAKPVEALPQTPPIGGFVPHYEASGFLGLGAPRGTPRAVINKLNETINAGLADPKIKAQLLALGDEPLSRSPAGFGQFIAAETDSGQSDPRGQHQAGVMNSVFDNLPSGEEMAISAHGHLSTRGALRLHFL